MSSSSSCLGVVLFVVRRTEGGHRYLLVRRSGGRFSGQWWPVAGTCHPGESPPVTALRELREETGLRPISLHRTQLQVPHSEEQGFLSIFLALVESSDRVVLNYEHDEFQWLTADGVKALIPSQTYRSVDILEGILRSPSLEGAARVWPEPDSAVG